MAGMDEDAKSDDDEVQALPASSWPLPVRSPLKVPVVTHRSYTQMTA